METVKLYTRQNEKTLHQLERDGRIINNRIYVQLHFGNMAQHYMESYDWFTAEAAKRVPKPDDVQASIWCSIDVRHCLRPIPETVVYALEVPKNQVIYFDEDKWDYVLNRMYLPKDEADQIAYQKHIEQLGAKEGNDFFQGRFKMYYPEERQKIIDSWQRVFEIENFTIYNVCGNIWEIKKEWIRQIAHPGEGLID